MKQELIEQLQKLVHTDDKTFLVDIIRKMVEPMVEAMGKSYLIEQIVQEMVAIAIPVQQEVAAEAYNRFYTEEQLKAYIKFLQANPWFTQANRKLSEWTIQATQEKTQPLYEEIFKRYLEDNEDEDEPDDEDNDY